MTPAQLENTPRPSLQDATSNRKRPFDREAYLAAYASEHDRFMSRASNPATVALFDASWTLVYATGPRDPANHGFTVANLGYRPWEFERLAQSYKDAETADALAAFDAAAPERAYAAAMVVSSRSANRLPAALRSAVESLVSRANGGRKTRLLSSESILGAIAGLIAGGIDGYEHFHGGHVANAYGYASTATIAMVVRRGDVVGVNVTTGSGTKGTTGYGQLCLWDNSARPIPPTWLWIRVVATKRNAVAA